MVQRGFVFFQHIPLPLRMVLRALLRPRVTLPDFMTSWSLELMFSCEDFLVFCGAMALMVDKRGAVSTPAQCWQSDAPALVHDCPFSETSRMQLGSQRHG